MGETGFFLRPVETERGRLALVTIDNGEDHTKPTTFGRHALESLERLLPELEDGDWAGLVLTGKPHFFSAGADIAQFPNVTPELAREGSRAGHELFGRLRALRYPTLAAVNGVALGGGAEIALHCRWRTMASSVRHFGCPEVFLGLFPAWGGTQLVPRLVSGDDAVKFLVENPLRQNRMLDARRALEAGFVDAVFDPVEFLDDSIAFLLARLDEPARPDRDLADVAEAVRKARSRIEDQVHGATPAPYVALDLAEGAATWSLEEGYRREEDAIAELLPSRTAQASLYAFDLVERRAKRGLDLDAQPRKVQKVGIVGAGLMASQLAALFLRRLEVPIVLRDLKPEIVEGALSSIRGELAGLVAKGRYTEDRARFLGSIVSGGTGWEQFEGCDLVLEAVFEELSVKKEVFAALEDVVGPACVLATNTSSLSVAGMGSALRHPERVVGVHFFNPVALMPLVELIRTAETNDETLATAAEVVKLLGKRGVLVKDAPGFVVNRVLTRMTRVLMEAIEHGTPVDDTDEAMLRLGMPMAPSVLLQVVGPRVANHVLGTMHEAFPDRFPLSPALQSIADGGEPVVVADERWTVDEVTERVLAAMADEIARLLEEGVAGDARDVDTCLLLGAGFPFFLGGITRHLDEAGVSERVAGRRLAEIGGAVPA